MVVCINISNTNLGCVGEATLLGKVKQSEDWMAAYRAWRTQVQKMCSYEIVKR
jgi:hypothetical protein